MTSILDRQRERFRATPGDNQAFEALEEHLFLAGEWTEVIELYQHRLTAPALAANPKERAQVRFRMGQVFLERLDDSDRAIECLGAVLRDDPKHRQALMHLRRIHTTRGNWDVALQIAEVEVVLPMPPSERAALLCDMGLLWLDQLDDPQQALSQFESALEAQPDRREALEGAARAYERSGRHHDAAKNWERLAAQLKGPARAAAHVSLAKLAEGPLEQAERAQDLYRNALGDDPRNRDAIRAVSEQAKARHQWPVLADLLERRYELGGDGAERVKIAVDLARLHLEHLGNPAAARMWFSRAAELGSENVDVYEGLADFERKHGSREALLRFLERALALRGDEAPASLLLEVACLHSDRGEDERALDELQRASERAPEDPLVLEALSETLSRLGRDEDLVDVLERRAALAGADPAAQAAVLGELGALHEERLGDVDAACHAYERAFETHPPSPGIAAALERLYRKSEEWESLRDFLGVAGRYGPPDERIGYLCSLGALQSDHFGDVEAGVRALEAALLIDPTHAVAYRGLQHLASKSGDEDAILSAYQREADVATDRTRFVFLVTEIARILEDRDQPQAALEWIRRWVDACPEDRSALAACADLQEKVGCDAEFVATLETLDGLLTRDEQAANRRRLGAVHAAAGRIDSAIAAYRSALEVDPTDVATLEALESHLEAESRLEELAQTRRQLAELLPADRRAQCLDELAKLLSERLGDVGGAIEALTRLAAEENAPADVGARLEQLYERGARYEELAAHLAERAAALDEEDPDVAAVELRRAAVLLDHLGRFDDAVTAYRAVRERNHESSEAWAGLERALRIGGDAGALAEFLAERMEAAPEAEARERCAFERAVLLEESLGAVEEASGEFRRLAGEAVQSELRIRAAERLEGLLERSGDWETLREHLETVLENAATEDRQSLHERLARLCRDRLGDAEGAIAHFKSATDLAPERADLWRDLAHLYDDAERIADLVGAFEAELATGPDRDREIALRSRAAEHCVGFLEDPDRARGHYERILELDSSHAVASEFLVAHCEGTGDFNTVVRLLETRLAALDGAPRDSDGPWAAQRTSLRVRIAGLRATELDDLDGAIAVLEPALGEIGPKPVVAEPLADLYQRADYVEDLIALCGSAAEACEVEAERANWFVRLGDTLRQSGRHREAAEAYRKALAERPDDREVQAALRDLYRRLGEDEPLTRLLEVELSHLAGAEEVPTRLELAKLLTGPQDRPAEALIHLRRVLQIEPGHRQALEQALEIAERLHQNDVVLELLGAALARPQPPTARAALMARRGHLLAEVENRPDDAVTAFREALALDPTRSADRVALRTLLASQGDWEAVLDCLFQEASGAGGDARASLFELAASIAWEQFSPDGALPWLERLRRERPDDPAVVARIAEVHRRADRPEALLRALDCQIAVAAEPRARHHERATILENRLGSPARAIAALEDALRASPGDVETLKHLERLYRLAGRDRERARVLEALVESSAGESRVALLCDAAAIYEGPLGEPERAVEHLLSAVAAARGSSIYAELLRALGEALRAAARPDAWARCAEEELRVLDPDAPVLSDRRRQLRRDLAAVYENELGRPDAALGHLRALVSLKWTETHGAGTGELDAIEKALLRLLRSEKNWVELERRLAAHLDRRPDDPNGWLELARLREERLRTPVAAAEAYRAVLERRPSDVTAIRGLRRCAEIAGDWEAVAGALELELERASKLSARQRSALLRALGDVCWHRLESTTRASRSYASALEASPQDFGSLRSLQRLLEAMEDWRGALDLYESETVMLGDRDPERRREAALRAGEIARDHTGEPERALRNYVYAAGIGELPVARRGELAELHRRNGDTESFAEAFASWCDDPAAQATPAHHAQLAEALEELDRNEEALERIGRALELGEESASVWDTAARLRERCGDAAGAAEALERAAALLPDGEAAPRLLRAALLSEQRDADGAETLLRAAARRDPGNPAISAALARVCAALGDRAEALEMAQRAIDLDAAEGGLEPQLALETALVGARAAGERGNGEAAARLYAHALAVAPEHADALAEYGETLAGLGELRAARTALEARLALEAPDDRRALHLAMLGGALEAAGERDAARERLEEAIAEDPQLDRAHEDLVRLHEKAGEIDAGVACLERWADVASEPGERALRLLRAAEWEIRSEERVEAAERHLREALEVGPEIARVWETLATLLWDRGRADDALEVVSLALDGVADPEARGSLALIQGRALEQRGERQKAAEAFAIAARENPRCIEAALSRARLLRGLGEWQPAAETLRDFTDRHPGDDVTGLADVFQQLGRLLAGPLEDVEGAIAAYRRAIELDPERIDTRAALAEFLSHRPADRDEALGHHRALLEADPTHGSSLRVLMRIARERGNATAIAGGLEILRALGIATPHEREEESPDTPPTYAGDRELANPLWEKLRRVANEASHEIAAALEASDHSSAIPSDDPVSAFRAAALAAEGQLTASALIPLTEHELCDVLKLVCALALEPDEVQGDGHLVNAMSSAIRWRTRRRLKRILEGESLEVIAEVDFAAWRTEVRALAAAVALDETGGDLRTALAVLVSEESDRAVLNLSEGADLTPYVAAYPLARALLRRVVRTWLQSL